MKAHFFPVSIILPSQLVTIIIIQYSKTVLITIKDVVSERLGLACKALSVLNCKEKFANSYRSLLLLIIESL